MKKTRKISCEEKMEKNRKTSNEEEKFDFYQNMNEENANCIIYENSNILILNIK